MFQKKQTKDKSDFYHNVYIVLTNRQTRRILRYIFIGGLTTLVSFGTFSVLYYRAGMNSDIANTLSVIFAVLFAYITNKTFVFHSKCKSVHDLIKEVFSFFASRGVTMLLEVFGVFLLHTVQKIDAMLSKIMISIIVLITNYILSQFFVFRKTSYYRKED